MKKLLLATSLFLSSNVIAAEPITVFGINAGMSIEERVDVLRNKGLACYIKTKLNRGWCSKNVEGIENLKSGGLLLSPNNEFIYITESYTTFQCKTYSSCKASVSEYAKWVVNNSNSPTLEYNSETFLNPFTNQWQTKEEYVGLGNAGDKIIVREAEIELNKHILGETMGL